MRFVCASFVLASGVSAVESQDWGAPVGDDLHAELLGSIRHVF